MAIAGGVRGFLHSLLDSGAVEAVFVPMEIDSGLSSLHWSPIPL